MPPIGKRSVRGVHAFGRMKGAGGRIAGWGGLAKPKRPPSLVPLALRATSYGGAAFSDKGAKAGGAGD